MNQSLILLRHGQRQGSDDAITEYGKKQAEERGRFFFQAFGGQIDLMSSPKQRCLQSLEALSSLCKKPPQIVEDFSERFDFEDSRTFEKRVQSALEASLLKSSSAITLICSHSDWLFVGAKYLLDLQLQFLEASWIYLVRDQSKWILKDFVSSDEDFQIMKNQWQP